MAGAGVLTPGPIVFALLVAREESFAGAVRGTEQSQVRLHPLHHLGRHHRTTRHFYEQIVEKLISPLE